MDTNMPMSIFVSPSFRLWIISAFFEYGCEFSGRILDMLDFVYGLKYHTRYEGNHL